MTATNGHETVPNDGAAVARSIGMYIASETVAIRERVEGAIRLLTYAHRMSGVNPDGLPIIDALTLAQMSTSEAAKHARWWLDDQVIGLRSPVAIRQDPPHASTCDTCGHETGSNDE